MRTKIILRDKLMEKLREALVAVLPIIVIVLILCFSVAPISPSILLCFLIGAVLLVLGMMFFTLGAELSMTPMGEKVGTCMTKSKKLTLIVSLSFLLGFIITVSEPDLQVLAGQVPSIPNGILIAAVACGVGLFLVFALLRMLFRIPLPPLLIFFYILVFILALFVPDDCPVLHRPHHIRIDSGYDLPPCGKQLCSSRNPLCGRLGGIVGPFPSGISNLHS